MVCTNIQEIITDAMPSNTCPVTTAGDSCLDDLSRKKIAKRLMTEATITNININTRLESAILAIRLTSNGCEDRMITQSITIMLNPNADQVTNTVAGIPHRPQIKTSVAIATAKDTNKR
jgi:hypothetical protein